MEKMIKRNDLHNYVTCKPEFIPDEMIEYYFKASDVLVLPYNSIYQSGPLFLSYYFGLPVIASDVGSFREDIIEGKTGFICKPKDPQDLAKKTHSYFESDLYKNLKDNRNAIIKWADGRYSWNNIGDVTNAVYQSML
jgi:glycosyltransferase involved in cell wall biosynthesis